MVECSLKVTKEMTLHEQFLLLKSVFHMLFNVIKTLALKLQNKIFSNLFTYNIYWL